MTDQVTILMNDEPHTVPRHITALELKRACGIHSYDVVYALPLIVELSDETNLMLDEGNAFAALAPEGVSN